MKNKTLGRLVLTILSGSVLLGCTSQPDIQQASLSQTENIPDWVLNPIKENGIAASDCVTYGGNISIDRKLAIANARANIAQQISSRVTAMDKTYARRVDSQEVQNIGQSFESVSKQISNEELRGAQAVKVDIVHIDGKKHLCALVELRNTTRDIFEHIVKSSEKKLSAMDDSVLYEEFKSYKAQEALKLEIQNSSVDG